ncbi:hypothetical protein PUN4_430158 [Paraburkholderia unamae]|nr:hypothetical protein PUN4_430158 [Paraburkholderia unamae]
MLRRRRFRDGFVSAWWLGCGGAARVVLGRLRGRCEGAAALGALRAASWLARRRRVRRTARVARIARIAGPTDSLQRAAGRWIAPPSRSQLAVDRQQQE